MACMVLSHHMALSTRMRHNAASVSSDLSKNKKTQEWQSYESLTAHDEQLQGMCRASLVSV